MDWDPNTIYENGLVWIPKARLVSLEQIRSALTYTYGDSKYSALKGFRNFTERKEFIGIPRHFLKRETLLRLGIPIIDLRPKEFERIDVDSRIILDKIHPELDVQKDSIERLQGSLTGDGIISLACGLGKTPTALHYWTTLKCPLLVICDNTSILEQWENMIRLFVSPTDLKVGHVYGGKSEWDRPVVLASIQSLLNVLKSLPMEIRRKFGLIIYDEAHKLGAPEFSKIAPMFPGRRLGLTATHNRTDRLDAVFKGHLGDVLFEYLKQTLVPRFYFYEPITSRNLMEDPLFRKKTVKWGELNLSLVWSELSRTAARTQEIANIVLSFMAEGRRVLVISQRKEMLFELQQRIPRSGLIIGKTKLAERARALAEDPVVLGIMGIAKEGLDASTLDTFVVCEPFKDENLFQQTIGRILRDDPRKQAPKVIIIQDNLGDGAGPVYGLAKRMRRVIEGWPESKGGPYVWEKLEL